MWHRSHLLGDSFLMHGLPLDVHGLLMRLDRAIWARLLLRRDVDLHHLRLRRNWRADHGITLDIGVHLGPPDHASVEACDRAEQEAKDPGKDCVGRAVVLFVFTDRAGCAAAGGTSLRKIRIRSTEVSQIDARRVSEAGSRDLTGNTTHFERFCV